MKKTSCLIFTFIFFNSFIFSVLSSENIENKMHNINFSFLLPIDVSGEKGTRINLSFTAPKDFRCLQNDKVLNESTYPGTLEFIPKDNDEHNWSKIVTSNAYIGKFIKAKDLIDHMKNSFLKNSINLKIIEENVSQIDSVETAVLSMTYEYKGRREFVRIKAFSGPADCASIQYAAALKKEEKEDKVFEEIKAWMENSSNLKLVNF